MAGHDVWHEFAIALSHPRAYRRPHRLPLVHICADRRRSGGVNMSSFCTIHRVPHAGIDPIVTERAALAVINMVLEPPLRHDTVVITLDRERRGRSLVVIHETDGTTTSSASSSMVVGIDDDELDASHRGDGPSAGGGCARSRRPRRRPLDPGVRNRRGCRARTRGVVRGRRRCQLPARPARRATTMVSTPDRHARSAGDRHGDVRARRSAGDSRSPPARRRRTSSRLSTSSAPSSTSPGRYSSGMS